MPRCTVALDIDGRPRRRERTRSIAPFRERADPAVMNIKGKELAVELYY
jgi:hypothetical protein